ncbi:hypothetical protein CU669_06475 [Paramagnetospirillum kuznetsovii]|uniref:Glycosyltransferase RgtA/B/C/D-like domain-containing protein n=1 Tax=Paramagnetospirillum kuznetsovii TaxID=2053833 RepID=A0A364P1M3_9PROT|nr:hypothetical protein [Paramagnetospirillum kuznetsovii]RAU23015.1 hypothetical protein CU669_06475 [Paramagnetospirillum kuznetsovii]
MIQLLGNAALLYLPSAYQALALACLVVVVLGLVAIGAALAGRDRLPEADLLVGWSVVAGIVVVFGGWLGVSLTILSAVSLLLALGSALVLWRRRQAPLDGGVLRILVWMVPILVATASMEPSQWDEFSQWLPNARYLTLFDTFPGPGNPPTDSVFPAYPPAMTVIYLLSSRLGGHYFDTVAPWFNLLLLASSARLVVRLFRGDDGAGWSATAWGVLAVTALGTTFVPKLVFSGYADTATAVAVAFSAILGLQLRQGGGRGLQFAAVFALLPMTKQGNFALMALLLGALVFDCLRHGDGVTRFGKQLALTMVPVIVVSLAWRLHVTAGVGELSVRAVSDWEWALLPDMLNSMAGVILSKGGYFGAGFLLVAIAVLGLGRQRLVTLFALCFLGYNIFLLVVYLAILAGYESAHAASYWRYNTHLGMLEMFVLTQVIGQRVGRLGAISLARRAALAVGGLAAIIIPFAAVKYIRFDRNPAKMDALRVIRDMAPLLPPAARLTVIDARGTGFYGNFTNYHLGYGQHVSQNLSTFNTAELAKVLTEHRPDYIWLRTQNPEVARILAQDPDASHLLKAEGDGWRVVKSWPFPPGIDPAGEKD